MSSGRTGIGHPWIDARSFDMARVVVARIDAGPCLFNVALENLERWRRLHGTLSRAREEWEQILKRPWHEIRAILLDESDEGTAARELAFVRRDRDRGRAMGNHRATSGPPPPRKPVSREDLDPELVERVLEDGPRLAPRSDHEDDEATSAGADPGQDSPERVSRQHAHRAVELCSSPIGLVHRWAIE